METAKKQCPNIVEDVEMLQRCTSYPEQFARAVEKCLTYNHTAPATDCVCLNTVVNMFYDDHPMCNGYSKEWKELNL